MTEYAIWKAIDRINKRLDMAGFPDISISGETGILSEPEPVCAREGCGHPQYNHGLARTNPDVRRCFIQDCLCNGFVPTAEPAPPLDPFDIRERLTGWLENIELSQAVFSLRGLKVSYTPDELADVIVRVVGDGGR